MTKTQYHELQMTLQTLDTIDQQLVKQKPVDFMYWNKKAAEYINAMLKYANENPDEIFDHPFWNDNLAEDVKKEDFLSKNLDYSYSTYSDNGGVFTLVIEKKYNDDNLYYGFYKEESDIEADIEALKKLGYKIHKEK